MTPDAPDTEELTAWLRLALTAGIGNRSARRLLAAFGLPQAIFGQTHAALAQVVSHPQATALLATPPELPAVLAATLQWLQPGPGCDGGAAIGRRIITLGDAQYPASLLQTEDPPLLLHVMGQTQLLGAGCGNEGRDAWPAHALAMVGSRNPTPQGRQNAQCFAQAFCASGMTIVSGMALGIDAAAHEGALAACAHGTGAHLATIAVIGTGIDRVYPRQHRDLAHRIARAGLIVSEYPVGTPPLAANFPKRNRLIAALARGTLVVEAALQSGSLITARLAAEQGREVFAIPGSIHSPQSRGAHALIKQGAKLVENAQDVLDELRLPASAPAQEMQGDSSAQGTQGAHGLHDTAAPPPATAADAHTESAGQPQRRTRNARTAADAPQTHAAGMDSHSGQACALLQAIGGDPASLDALQARTGLPTPDLQARLLELELAGHIARLPGGLFQRLSLA